MTEFTISNLPEYDSIEEQALSLLSILVMSGVRSCILGLVVPIGKPKYVKGIDPTAQPKAEARTASLSGWTFIGIILDLA